MEELKLESITHYPIIFIKNLKTNYSENTNSLSKLGTGSILFKTADQYKPFFCLVIFSLIFQAQDISFNPIEKKRGSDNLDEETEVWRRP